MPRHLPVAILAAALPAMPVDAFDCEMFFTCCQQLVDAHREAGVTGQALLIAEQTCHVHEALASVPAQQEAFCAEAWMILSEDAYADYLAGRIGIYPEACMEDPVDLDLPVD